MNKENNGNSVHFMPFHTQKALFKDSLYQFYVVKRVYNKTDKNIIKENRIILDFTVKLSESYHLSITDEAYWMTLLSETKELLC